MSVTFVVRVSWWAKPYCIAMIIWYSLCGREITSELMTRWIMRGVTMVPKHE